MSALQKRSIITLLLAMVLLGVFPLDVILPSFPALSAYFATPATEITWSISVFAIGVAVSQFFLGPLSDKVGRKGLLILGLMVSIVGAIGCANASDFPAFMAFRILQAIGCGCFVLLNALVQDMFEADERDRVRILVTSASGLFISLSPLAGTLLQDLFRWQGSFYLFALIGGAVLVYTVRNLPPTRGAERTTKGMFQASSRLLRDPGFMGFTLIAAIAFTCHFSFIAISPIIFLEQLQLSPLAFGLTLLSYGAAYVFGGLIANRLQKVASHREQLITGLALIGLAGIALLILGLFMNRSVTSILLPMMICTLGTTIARPAATSRAMELFPDSAGASASMLNTLVFVAGGLASTAISLVADDAERMLGLAFTGLCAIGLLMLRRICPNMQESL